MLFSIFLLSFVSTLISALAIDTANNLSEAEASNLISSILPFEVTNVIAGAICTDTNYGGRCAPLLTNYKCHDLSLVGEPQFLNRQISSLIVTQDWHCDFYSASEPCPRNAGPNRLPVRGQTLYPALISQFDKRINSYQCHRFKNTISEPKLSDTELQHIHTPRDDSPSQQEIKTTEAEASQAPPYANMLCENANFVSIDGGHCSATRSDGKCHDLSSIQLDRKISAVQIMAGHLCHLFTETSCRGMQDDFRGPGRWMTLPAPRNDAYRSVRCDYRAAPPPLSFNGGEEVGRSAAVAVRDTTVAAAASAGVICRDANFQAPCITLKDDVQCHALANEPGMMNKAVSSVMVFAKWRCIFYVLPDCNRFITADYFGLNGPQVFPYLHPAWNDKFQSYKCLPTLEPRSAGIEGGVKRLSGNFLS